MVRNDVEVFLRKAQASGFHARGDHLEGLARADAVRQQRVPAIQDVRYRVLLVRHQRNLRRHPDKTDVAAVILPRPHRIKQFIVFLYKGFPPVHILKNPLFEGGAQHFLFLLGEDRGFFVQHALFAVQRLNGHVDFGVLQVQRVFQQMQGVGLFRAVDRIDQGVARIAALAADVPRAGDRRILCTNRAPCHPCGHGKHVAQKPVDVNGVYPRRAKAHFDLGGIQLFGLYPPQRFRIDGVFRRGLGRVFCLAQFPAHIAGQILVAGFPYMGDRILKDDAPQFICDFPFCFAAQRRHEFQVDARFFPDGQRQRFAGCIHAIHRLRLADRPLGENIRLAFEFPVLIQYFQRG